MRAPAYSTLIIALLIAVTAVVFAFQNDGEIAVTFLRWTAQGSVATILLTSFGLGVVATTLALLPTLIKSVSQTSAAKRHAKKLRKELTDAKQHAHDLVAEVAKARGAAEEAEKLSKPPSGNGQAKK